jgi:hypothetical protein
MSRRVINVEQEQAKRQLRAEIAWLRHRTASRITTFRDGITRFDAWRKWLPDRPLGRLLDAAAIGLSAASRIGRPVLRHSWRLMFRAARLALRTIVRQVRRRWSKTDAPATSNGGGADVVG